jgi:DNA helicase II / ATP-dependent DNA helicase PcrA
MFNRTESEERRHLEQVKHRLGIALRQLERRVSRYARDVRDQKTHMWEHKSDMDHIEKISARESADQTMRSGLVADAARRRLEKLVQSPYFGRVDFAKSGNGSEVLPVYVGIHSFSDDQERTNLVFDWRAPISTLFYDFEIGPASYGSPSGEVRGEVGLKRQYRIRGGRMEFMLESGLNILDDVLQEELSKTSDDRMKTIVATIQRDQNAIVRNDGADVLVIQGVAGSGKTSIALHRVAFLLYRFKDSLQSKDVLILSPNRVFADFISNVLPELGEEPIAEMEMEGIAREILGPDVDFESALEQSSRLLDGGDERLRRRIQAKSSFEFLDKLGQYAAHVEQTRFRPQDISVAGRSISAGVVADAFRRRGSATMAERLRAVVESVDQELWVRWRHELTTKERAAVRAAVKKMSRNTSLKALYKGFYAWLGEPELFKPLRGARLEYSDVFPLVHLKLRLERPANPYRQIKHLVVDEMQDYTPLQYEVLARLFPCRKTILGDVSQSLNAGATIGAEAISRVFVHAECVKLCKSYRSSYEITRFAQGIAPSADLVAIERHGPKPVVVECRNEASERLRIVRTVTTFAERGHRTLGVLCKSQAQAERLFEAIRERAPEIQLLTARSTAFVHGPVVCAVHLAKGLEFDQVVVPGASAENYSTSLDRSLLYVACTRAMHELVVTFTGAPTRFFSDVSLHVAERD